ncbi:MAG: hypothetical protein M3P98_01590 [bacterium]|nr:hypothetical protein [bacterium]
MKSIEVVAGASAKASEYNALRQDATASSWLLPHEKTVPNMTLYVEPGQFWISGVKYTFAGGYSPTVTAPVGNPRIDLLTINSAGVLALTTGVTGAVPVPPSYPTDKIVICEIYIKVASTTIRDTDVGGGVSYINVDTRPFMALVSAGGGFNTATVTYDSSDRVATIVDTLTSTTYTFTWSTNDTLTTVANGTYTWTFAWDSNGRLTGITRS